MDQTNQLNFIHLFVLYIEAGVKYINIPVFVIKVPFVKLSQEFLKFFLELLEIYSFATLRLIDGKIIRKEYFSVIEAFHNYKH
jgi:hypothetical protein